ncbi:conserved hypothetical protein [Bathymodiolus platifrons methanotrophic gill symbiont]|uniref:ATP-binding protein n=1 Tax=Bathymodiolus platifrons methanotrophic gill symbiont TaxID=113268 RepID=UPI000B4130D6|nr:ATP-binding protein [Bathymodiolus platifrons methanotrophic gill symbiont]GAW87689.1 conserved hypothetical protein [Bathymodiolus platifrons methanotrophic gill symbiont]GFO77898.1 uncharacterized protein BPLS_P6631 [Bathymodiolus platifrons methanotrophic gill symbiont]
MDIEKEFPKGLLRSELFMGVLSSVSAYSVRVNLNDAGSPSGSHFSGSRYGKGEVGEFVLIEGQLNLLLGRVTDIKLPEIERRSVTPTYDGKSKLDAYGNIQLLGTVSMDTLKVTAGVASYPRLGDRVYAAPLKFVSKIPTLMDLKIGDSAPLTLKLGSVDIGSDNQSGQVEISPEKLFGRHCAIIGATGGGKSWTTSRIIEECLQHKSKIILLDATGEYRDFSGDFVQHCHLGNPVKKAIDSKPCSLPPASFQESDFIALFEPAGKVQGPKFRAAIRSLRIANLKPNIAPDGFIKKINQPKSAFQTAEQDPEISVKLDDPKQEFDVSKLPQQIEQECVWPDGFNDTTKWGKVDGNFSHCLSLLTRINAIFTSPAFDCVFNSSEESLSKKIDTFLNSDKRLLRVCLSGVAYEFKAREIIANVIGRDLLMRARDNKFITNPLIVIVDEAHNFLGRNIGTEDTATKLDSFEFIAKEGRKYGLNICLATQRPRDITEGVLSQMGTLIVHRLTNDRDREVVERACGEIDRSASAFLPNLKPGEAAILGADFPIPLTIQIKKPTTKPNSDGPDFQKYWKEV